jgi:uncharacterized glyoxalase superfamily protein PhnB
MLRRLALRFVGIAVAGVAVTACGGSHATAGKVGATFRPATTRSISSSSSDANAEHPARPSVSYAYVPDVDDTFARAMAAGATAPVQPENHAWGDRVAGFTDPFANRWWIAPSRPRP